MTISSAAHINIKVPNAMTATVDFIEKTSSSSLDWVMLKDEAPALYPARLVQQDTVFSPLTSSGRRNSEDFKRWVIQYVTLGLPLKPRSNKSPSFDSTVHKSSSVGTLVRHVKVRDSSSEATEKFCGFLLIFKLSSKFISCELTWQKLRALLLDERTHCSVDGSSNSWIYLVQIRFGSDV